jgi:O-antigen/teichoic acid export membrane protein
MFILLIGIILSLLVGNFSLTIFSYMFEEKYQNVGLIIGILAWAIPFKLMESYLGAILTSREFIYYKLKAVIFVSISSTCLIYLIGINFGLIGAAWLYLSSEVIIALVFYLKIRSFLHY